MKYLNRYTIASIFLGAGLLFHTFGCKSSQGNTGEKPLSWEILKEGSHAGISEAKNVLIQDAKSWESLWTDFGKRSFPPPALPAINFEQQAVIVCFMGEQNSGGYQVKIQDIELSEDVLLVRLLHVQPGPTCMVTEALTQPYIMATVNRSDIGQADFKIDTRTDNCDQ